MQRCLGCMREFGEAYDVCPHCGYVVGTPPASRTHLAPGTMLQGRYMLGKVLGQGGFGITYIAWDNRIGRAVAIKEYMPHAFASRITGEKEISCYNIEAQRQFDLGLEKTRRETNALSQFGTLESVVKVYDCIEENKTAYIIMELLRGKTVKEILAERGKLTFAETMRIMTPVLQTLDAMHSVGMIHRDVAPDNIFVCEDGRIKLLDFGAARVVSDTDDKTLSVILKAGYAPFEQYSSQGQQGPFTDVYAASATIYTMLTGTCPQECAGRMQEDNVRPIRDFADVPVHVDAVIRRGMAFHVKDRTPTAGQLLAELQSIPPEPAPSTVPFNAGTEKAPSAQHTNRKKTWFILAAVALLVVLIAVFTVLLLSKFGKTNAGDKDIKPLSAEISAGDIFTFGTYEQDNDLSNGSEPIEWIVLKKDEDGDYLVISRYALNCQPFNIDDEEVTWETCSLRAWLNEVFLQDAFSVEEQGQIYIANIPIEQDGNAASEDCEITEDTLFLLSYFGDELENCLSEETRVCEATAYAVAQGGWTSDTPSDNGGAPCWWWLRTPGSDSNDMVSMVSADGSYYDTSVSNREGGVRPVMWVSPEKKSETAQTLSPASVGDVFQFGSYPQSEVTDKALIEKLNRQSGTWQSYGYYIGTGNSTDEETDNWDGKMKASDFMRYKDVSLDGLRYRGVTFDRYRPRSTDRKSSAATSYQDENGYVPNTTYWFLFEPLQWRLLDADEGLVLCESIIDSQAFNSYSFVEGTDGNGYPAVWGDANERYYANNYAHSDIRAWLNDDFYNTAFSDEEKTNIQIAALNNDCDFTLIGEAGYDEFDAPTTNDKVFLLSKDEFSNSAEEFVFSSKKYTKQRLTGTDYANCQGFGLLSESDTGGMLFRTPSGSSSGYVTCVFENNENYSVAPTLYSFMGICPALKIADLSILEGTD